MSLSCSESGLPSVASIISVLQHRATDLIAFSMVVYMHLPSFYPHQPESCTAADDKQYPIQIRHYKVKCLHKLLLWFPVASIVNSNCNIFRLIAIRQCRLNANDVSYCRVLAS